MIFRHTTRNEIHLGDLTIPLEVFLDLEPEYALPDGCVARYYNPNTKHFLVQRGQTTTKLPINWPYGDYLLKRKNEFDIYLRQIERP